MKCRVCLQESIAFEQARVLGKYDVQYYRCPACGLMQTEEPYWLDEAYTEVINASDVGLVARNLEMARATRALIKAFLQRDEKYVDYGGGYGLFVRLMRDAGFAFHRHDPYCENYFAQGLDVALPPPHRYELLTAFEVFEHLVRPREDLATMAELADNIFFSTNLLPPGPPRLGDWWYYGLEHGQHVTLYTLASLRRIAADLGKHLYSNGVNLHLFSRKPLSPLAYRLVVSKPGSLLLELVRRKHSLIADDYARVSGHQLK